MVRFSCFQAHTHFNFSKHKRTVHLSSEAMQKTLEDSQSRSMSNYSSLDARNMTCVKDEENTLHNNAEQATHSSLAERDCRSEENEDTDPESGVYNDKQMKKCLSLGSRLSWKDRTRDLGDSGDEMDQKVSSGGTADRSGIIELDGSNNRHGFSVSDLYQEPMPSDSVQVNCEFGKESIYSNGDSKVLEKECIDGDDIHLSGGGDLDDHTPRTPPAIVRSSSLPSIVSPNQLVICSLQGSRSCEDLKALDSRKKGIQHEVGKLLRHQGDHSNLENEKHNGEYQVDDTYETYNYIGSAKDWIIPLPDGADMDKSMKGEPSFNHWESIPAKDFRLRRIEEWVSDLKHCSPLEESDGATTADNHVFSNTDDLQEEHKAGKPEVKVGNPGSEAAKRYISSLNASATAAQLTNLGLVVIPFLSAFASLKALNLSGNSIARITAGALPRGLHILNLSRNRISTIEGLRELTRLRVLDLSYNRLVRIGHGLAGCSSLKELYLAGNKISEVEGLHRLLKLNILDLRFNKISTAKSLGQLASNYNCLQAISLEGNPAQKNVGDEQLKKYVQSLLPHLTYYNRQSIKVGKDAADRSARLSIGAHQIDRGLRVEVKNSRKGTHGIVAQKVASSSSHGRKSQVVSTQKPSRNRHARLPPTGTKGLQASQVTDFSSRLMSLRNDISIRRSRSEGTLGALQ